MAGLKRRPDKNEGRTKTIPPSVIPQEDLLEPDVSLGEPRPPIDTPNDTPVSHSPE